MSVAPGSSLLLAVHLFGSPANVDWGYGARSEIAAGSIPVNLEERVAPAAEAFFELNTGMRVSTPTSSLVLRYTPRLLGRIPGTEQFGRPLLFNTLSLVSTAAPTQRLVLGLTGSAGAGEIAYSGIQAFFAPGTAGATTSTFSIVTADGEASASYRLTRRNTARLALRASAQAPLYEDDEVPTFRSVGATLGDEYRWSRVDTIGLTATVGYTTSEELGEIVIGGADFTYQRRLDEASLLGLQAGAVAARRPDDDEPTILPTGSVSYTTAWGSRTRRWTGELAGGAQGLFDPLRYDYRPVGFARAALGADVGPDFHTGVVLHASSSLRREPTPDVPFETVVNLTLPSTYRLNDRFDLTFGARSSLLGPHRSELTLELTQAQFLLYVGFRHRDGTEPSRGSWL